MLESHHKFIILAKSSIPHIDHIIYTTNETLETEEDGYSCLCVITAFIMFMVTTMGWEFI